VISDPLRAWCESVVGPFLVLSEHGHTHGEAQVWRLRACGKTVYLKIHRQAGKWAGEVHAYECGWASCFGDHAPHLLAARAEEPRAVLLTELPGAPMEQVTLSPQQEIAAWKAAGRALAPLHTLTNDWFGACRCDGSPQQGTPPTSPVRFVLTSIEDGIQRCLRAGVLSCDEEAFARACLAAGVDAFAGEKAVPCHRDYGPRNWIVTRDDGVWRGVIDFEHARWDVRARELCRWWDREFLGRPNLVDAFFAGYSSGERPRDTLLAQIQTMRLINALGGISWSVEHDDIPFLALNRATLTRLRQEHKA